MYTNVYVFVPSNKPTNPKYISVDIIYFYTRPFAPAIQQVLYQIYNKYVENESLRVDNAIVSFLGERGGIFRNNFKQDHYSKACK